jgi:hypothetical protein
MLRLLEHHRLTTGKSEMTNVVVTVKWWKKFEMKKFDYDTFFRFKTDNRFVFVLKSDYMDMKLAKEYCEGHGLDPNSSQLIVDEVVPRLEAQLGRDRRSV